MILEQFSNDLFGSSVGVDVGGVVEVDSEIESTFYNLLGLVDLYHPGFGVAEGHCSETDA